MSSRNDGYELQRAAVCVALVRKASQRVMFALDLIAVQRTIYYGEINARPTFAIGLVRQRAKYLDRLEYSLARAAGVDEYRCRASVSRL
jgi:hypothetical protein